MSIKDTLAELGLGKKATKIYLAALEQGTASASVIAQKAGIQRTAFYDTARTLIDAGFLLRTVQNKKTLFTAINPESLLDIQRKRIEKLERILPELKAIHNIKGIKPKISYYEGPAGIELIGRDTLKFKNEIVGFSTPRFLNFNEKQFGREYISQRVALRNRVRVIGEVSPEILELKRHDKEELRETRMLPQTLFHSDIEIGIYGHKVFILDYKQEFGFIIESQEIASVLKMIFEIVWNSGRIVEVD